MTIRTKAKNLLLEAERVWMGPGRGMHLVGPNSARVYLGLYEAELNQWIRQLAQPGVRTFDIGAQYGLDAVMFARLTDARVLTIDSDPELEQTIRRNIDSNRLDDKVEPFFCCIGDGTKDTVSIDKLASRYFVPGFIKMDIEGAEASALRGAEETLAACGRWLIETHSLKIENECLQILTAHGFRLEIQNPRRWLPDFRPAEHNRWLIAVKPSLND